jgi:hypothetical protein
LGEAAQAHRDLESRKTTGKLLLLPSTCCSDGTQKILHAQ